MAFPNTPLDPEIAVWGWPWHGPLTWGGAGGWVTLPSGRTVPVTNVTHWTYLWDVGMPVSLVETDDPDEQWWNAAVLRAARGGRAVYAYGGQAINAGRVLLEGQVGDFGLTVTSDNETQLLRMSFGVGVMNAPNFWTTSERTLTLTFTELDIPIPDQPVTGVEVDVLDRRPDGTGVILRLYRNYQPTLSAQETLALLEVRFSGAFDNLGVSHTILASGKDCRGRITVAADPGDDPGTIVRGGISRARVGEFLCDYSIASDYWAWYGESGEAEVLRFTARAVGTVTRTASVTGGGADMVFISSKQESYDYTYEISGGGVSLSVSASSQLSSDATAYGENGERTVDSGTMRTTFGQMEVQSQAGSSDTPGGIDEIGYFSAPEDDAIPALIPAMYAYPSGGFRSVHPLLTFAGVSNLAVEVLLRYPENVTTVFVPELRYYSSALTPSGVHGEPFSYTTSEGQSAGLDLASFNPVTHQVLRHLDQPTFGWV